MIFGGDLPRFRRLALGSTRSALRGAERALKDLWVSPWISVNDFDLYPLDADCAGNNGCGRNYRIAGPQASDSTKTPRGPLGANGFTTAVRYLRVRAGRKQGP